MKYLIKVDDRRRFMRFILKRLYLSSPVFIPVLTLGLLLAACIGYTTPIPVESPSPTRTRRPSDTPFPSQADLQVDSPTETPTSVQKVEPTRTESAEEPTKAPLKLGDVHDVQDGGFSFQGVIGYDVNILTGQATVVSPDGGFVLSLTKGDVPGADALEVLMEHLLVKISENFENFEADDPHPITVDGIPGLASDIRAELIGRPIAGKVAIAATSDTQLFYAFAFTIEEPEGRWESEGSEVFNAVIGSVDFYESNDE